MTTRRTLWLYWLLLAAFAIPAWIAVGRVGFSIATADEGSRGDRLMALVVAVPALAIAVVATAAAIMSWKAMHVSGLAASAWALAALCAGLLFASAARTADVLGVALAWIGPGAILVISLVLDGEHHRARRT